MVDLNAMFNIATPAETQEALATADHAKGYETASIMALTIDRQIRGAFPDQSPAFYRGVMDGIRGEI